MNKANQHISSDNIVLKQAHDWAIKLKNEACSEQEEDQFLTWIENPDHACAFTEAQQQLSELSTLKNNAQITALRKAVLADPVITSNAADSASPSTVVSIFSAKKKTIAASLSVGFSIAASLLIFTLLPYFSGIHQTDVGELRSLVLEDGTKVMLDSDSSIRVDYSKNKRVVYLRSGRAHFDVAKNPLRPFTVQSDNNAVTAVGTAFSVNNINNNFIVRLNEGTVDIQSSTIGNPDSQNILRLQEGEQWLALNQQTGRKEALDTTKLNWMKGSLVFKDAPLSEVIAEINRYSVIKIHLANTQIANSKIDAVFNIGQTTSFASALQNMLSLELDYDTKGNIVLSQTL